MSSDDRSGRDENREPTLEEVLNDKDLKQTMDDADKIILEGAKNKKPENLNRYERSLVRGNNIKENYKSWDSPITDMEKIILLGISKKFGQLIENCNILKDVHLKLDSLIFDTVDPYYIMKIIQIQTTLLVKNENTMQEQC